MYTEVNRTDWADWLVQKRIASTIHKADSIVGMYTAVCRKVVLKKKKVHVTISEDNLAIR